MLELIDYLFEFKKLKAKRYYSPKVIIKYCNVISNGKNFFDQPIDYEIKRHKEIRKLITGEGEDYTA